jgi:predicted acetyltransferase
VKKGGRKKQNLFFLIDFRGHGVGKKIFFFFFNKKNNLWGAVSCQQVAT